MADLILKAAHWFDSSRDLLRDCENFADLRFQVNLASKIHHKAAEGLVGGEPEGAPDLHVAAGQQVARVVDAVLVLCRGYRDGGVSTGRGRVGGEGYLGRGSNGKAQPGL